MSSEKPLARLHYLDNLRTSLVVLVVLHHIALVYGAAAPFYYQEPPFDDPLAFLLLAGFVLLNQSWFMGALFLLAGYFTPGSLDRKGPSLFLRGRLVRLGIPVLVGIFVLEPIARLGFFLMPASVTGITQAPTWSVYPALLGLGPLWFIALLLLFDVGYAAWRMAASKRPTAFVSKAPLPGYWGIGAFIAALALASYLIRIAVPLGQEVGLLAYFLNFPTIAYLPQYLAFFVLGILSYRHDWFRKVSGSLGLAGFAAAVVAAVLLVPPAISGHLFSVEVAEPPRFQGDGYWQSAAYALWDSVTAVGLCLGLIALFRRFFDGHGGVGRLMSRHSYAVYVIHAPIIVYLAFALRGVALEPLLKFVMAAVVIVPTCFAVAYGLRKIPLVSKVL